MSRTQSSPSRDTGSHTQPLFLDSLDARLPALPGRRLALSPREIEVRYFVPDGLAASLKKGDYISIEQHYFPEKTVRSLIKRFDVDERIGDHDQLTSARIRRSKEKDGPSKYELEFKGQKEEVHGALISRCELGIEISKELYEDLLPEATDGALKKRRYEIAGRITDGGTSVKILGHLDALRRSGNSLEKLMEPFWTIDIELPDTSLFKRLRAGNHNFDFLPQCIETGTLDNSLRKSLRNSSIAKKGIPDWALEKAKDEAEKVQKMLKKLGR